MVHTLVLVADEARARLFTAENRTGALTEIKGLVNPQARLREQDLMSDSSGGNPHDIGHHGKVHDHIANEFARDVSQTLGEAASEYKPKDIRVAAAPHFLGMLRKYWPHEVQASITQELAKNLTQLSPEQIRTHLPTTL